MSITLRLHETTDGPVTAVSAQFAPSVDKPTLYRVVSDRAIHLEMGDAGAVATGSSAYVPAHCIEYVNVDPNRTLNYIRAAGETDGTIWITRIDRV